MVTMSVPRDHRASAASSVTDGLPRSKAVTGVLVVVLLVLLAQAGLGALGASFSGLAVQRPFF